MKNSESGARWSEVKERTQTQELDIAASLPEAWVSEIEQVPDGFLLDCSSTEMTWNGLTKVGLSAGVDPTDAVHHLESRFAGTAFTIGTRLNVVGQYELQLVAQDGVENYIIAEGEPGTLRIASGSPCFVLPEDTYPGGTW
ncbi:hypothetical protein [Leucobacter sp. 7(1)]|uniref:hypothetical protein n=1 Tax=Leucobacter sp. 7(1) TaxID=1255613 RepID=UPI000B3505E8|nr:hypothetical protein [Leucobacter sp. 7(1)]